MLIQTWYCFIKVNLSDVHWTLGWTLLLSGDVICSHSCAGLHPGQQGYSYSAEFILSQAPGKDGWRCILCWCFFHGCFILLEWQECWIFPIRFTHESMELLLESILVILLSPCITFKSHCVCLAVQGLTYTALHACLLAWSLFCFSSRDFSQGLALYNSANLAVCSLDCTVDIASIQP